MSKGEVPSVTRWRDGIWLAEDHVRRYKGRRGGRDRLWANVAKHYRHAIAAMTGKRPEEV